MTDLQKWWKTLFISILKALFVLKICKFLSWLFGHVEKRFNEEDKANFEIYDVTVSLIKTHIAQFLTN